MDDLTFRPLAVGDLDPLHAMMGHWSVVRQLGSWPWPPDRRFTATRARPYAGRGFVWAVLAAGRFVGTVAVTGTARPDRGTLGYGLIPAAQGRGVATRAGVAALRHAFDADPDLAMIEASAWADNRASARVLCKLGFTPWQTRYERSKVRGLPILSHEFRLTRADWSATAYAAARRL